MWTLGMGDAYFENKENERQRKTASKQIELEPHTSTQNNEGEESDLEGDEFTFGIL
jgi:hypothetical protein